MFLGCLAWHRPRHNLERLSYLELAVVGVRSSDDFIGRASHSIRKGTTQGQAERRGGMRHIKACKPGHDMQGCSCLCHLRTPKTRRVRGYCIETDFTIPIPNCRMRPVNERFSALEFNLFATFKTEDEAKRALKAVKHTMVGLRTSVVPCTITYSLPRRGRGKK